MAAKAPEDLAGDLEAPLARDAGWTTHMKVAKIHMVRPQQAHPAQANTLKHQHALTAVKSMARRAIIAVSAYGMLKKERTCAYIKA